MNPVAIVQARSNSQRLPRKVLCEIQGRSVLRHVVDRLRAVGGLDVVAAIPEEDLALSMHCAANGIAFAVGSEDDVLSRYCDVAGKFNADPIVRVTADCPLVDSALVAELLHIWMHNKVGYMALSTGVRLAKEVAKGFPDGLDAECFSMQYLAIANDKATSKIDREHVTSYIWKRPDNFRVGWLLASEDLGHHRWCLDTAEDLAFVEAVYDKLYPSNPLFDMNDVLHLLEREPEIYALNRGSVGKEGYEKLWND